MVTVPPLRKVEGSNPPSGRAAVLSRWRVNQGSGSAQSSSAEAQTLVFAHVGAQEEGLELPFALDVDEAATLAGVAESLQDQRRLLRHLRREGGATLRCWNAHAASAKVFQRTVMSPHCHSTQEVEAHFQCALLLDDLKCAQRIHSAQYPRILCILVLLPSFLSN